MLENSKRVVAKLKEAIPRQLFEIAIQAKLSSKILVRDTIKAYRKDVLAKCVSISIYFLLVYIATGKLNNSTSMFIQYCARVS